MKVRITATDNLTQWIEENGSDVGLSLEDIKEPEENSLHINLELADANQVLQLIAKINTIDEVIIGVDSDNVYLEIYNDYRE